MGRRAGEFRDKSNDELEMDLQNFREELYRLRFQSATEQLANPKLMSGLRRDAARVLTILNERSENKGAES